MPNIETAKKFARHRRSDIADVCLRLTSVAPSHRLRMAVLRRFGANISASATLYGGFEVRAAHRLRLDDRATIGDRAILDARGGLTIGHDVNLSSDVHIWTAQHDWQSPSFAYMTGSVEIEPLVWLGPRVTVLPGAVVGRGARIAAGAVVHGTVPPYALYGGVPARPIRDGIGPFHYRLPSPSDKIWWR